MALSTRLFLLTVLTLASVIGLGLCQDDNGAIPLGQVFGEREQTEGARAARLGGVKVPVVCGKVYLKSFLYKFKWYTVVKAAKVISLNVIRELTDQICKDEINYGKYGTQIWVNRGCKGLFNVCYFRGYNKLVPCYSLAYKSSRCHVGFYIKTVTIIRHKSAAPCIEGFSYRVDGKDLIVYNGCRADFILGTY